MRIRSLESFENSADESSDSICKFVNTRAVDRKFIYSKHADETTYGSFMNNFDDMDFLAFNESF